MTELFSFKKKKVDRDNEELSSPRFTCNNSTSQFFSKNITRVFAFKELLDEIEPTYVHVMADGQIIKTGGSDLALELEKKGYEWTDNFVKEA